MSKKVIHVRPKIGGQWEVSSANGSQLYASKMQAVLAARSQGRSDKVIIQNSAGQVLRPAKLKTSRPISVIREAVYAAMLQKK
ncbi:hypothetical protein GJ699_30540 [Duganella sp. FT80W]|uniref:DUF2188 domain-containing protein n=1 Tax=Duganella guangzhouensis TaxID=2666084 RepID=A0A6I2L9E3_9BURK|nr:DUF2188 domain-containing protein [Duganella guangzhouensis]MRW94322.1 hypothetical protein [Duganella guangzhouensis]